MPILNSYPSLPDPSTMRHEMLVWIQDRFTPFPIGHMATNDVILKLKGIAWTTGYRVFATLAQFGTMLVLVRIIPPEECGRAGAVVGVLTMLNVLSCRAFISQALQLPEGEEPDWSMHWRAGFWLQATLFVMTNAIAGGLWFLAEPPLYRDPLALGVARRSLRVPECSAQHHAPAGTGFSPSPHPRRHQQGLWHSDHVELGRRRVRRTCHRGGRERHSRDSRLYRSSPRAPLSAPFSLVQISRLAAIQGFSALRIPAKLVRIAPIFARRARGSGLASTAWFCRARPPTTCAIALSRHPSGK